MNKSFWTTKTRPVAAIAGMVIVMMFSLVSPAAADVSPWNYYGPILGYNYQNRSNIHLDGSQMYFEARVSDSDAVLVPINYMGAQISLYKLSGGALCSSTTMTYNSYQNYDWVRFADAQCGHGIYYYARGSTAAYDGSPYANYYTAATPALYFP